MASQPQGRLLESPTDVHSQISNKLTEDGLNPQANDSEKLLFLWKLYQHVEDDLQKTKEAENKLKEAQAEEMKEVENYVEHIRHLSDEREALIQELEAENETLKGQVTNLEQGNNDAAQAEITEMLTQQGLAEISDATQSEQIAYLLVERARLLDELEEHNHSNSTNNSPNTDGRSSETELKQILEQERGDFEEELSQQRESAKMMKEQLKQEHEEEINALMEENSKLEEDLQNAEMMASQLKAELSKYTDGDENDTSLNQSLKAGNGGEEEGKLREERNQLNQERERLEKEIEEMEKESVDLKKEKDAFNQEKAAFEKQKSKFIEEKTQIEQLKEELEKEREQLDLESESIDKERKVLEKRIVDLDNRKADLEQEQEEFAKEKETWEAEHAGSPRAQVLRNGSPSRSSNDMALRKIIEEKTLIEGELVQLRTTLRSLQKEKDSHDDVVDKLKGDLEKSHISQQQLQAKNRSLKAELTELETQLDETETSIDSISKEKQNLSEKCDSLNSEVKTLRADAMKSSTLQDIVDILSNDKKQLSESLESLKSKFEQTSTEKEELANKNTMLSKEEQDLTNQLQVCKEELEKVTKERDHLNSDKHELEAVTKKQEEVERLLKADLEEMNKTKESYINQTETLSKENKDLLNRLDRTREELESAKLQVQELAKQQVIIDHLKDQNEQLQNHISSSQEELGKSKDRETMLITTQQSLQKSHDETDRSGELYTHEIDDLKLKLELTLQELAKTKKQLEDLSQEKSELGENLKRTEKLLHESAEVKEILEEEKRQKNNMKLEINRLELQLTEKTLLADKFEAERKQRLELESQVGSLRDVEDSLKAVSRELEKEQKMRQSLENHTQDLEKTVSERVGKEEFLSVQDAAEQEKTQRVQLESRLRDAERKLKEAEISNESTNEQLENEKMLRVSLESNVKELQSSMAQQGTGEELSRLREELKNERAALRDLEESKEDVQLLCGELEKERSLRAELTRKVAELEAASGESATSTLKATLDELERERRARADCDMKLQEMEQLLEDQKIDGENLHHSMSGKILSLERRVQALQDDLFTAQDELQAFQERYEEVVKEAEVSKLELVRQSSQPSNLSAPHQDSFSGSQHEEDLENSLVSTSAKLQETLNELNTVKSKLCQSQEELNSTKMDINNSGQEIDLLKHSLELATKQLEQSDEEVRRLRREFAETQGTLEFTENQLKEKQSKLDQVAQERDEIQRDLDVMYDEQQQRVTPRPIDPAFYGEEERQEHVDRISTLEKLSRQLELDNREMARKLSDTMSKSDLLEEQLQREKLRSTDKYQQSSRYTDQLEHDIDSANKHIRQLREELQQHQTKVFKLEADNLGLSAKYESTIARLEQENKDLKHRHRQELDNLSERMETSSTEARELRGQKREMEQELSQLRSEVSRLKSEQERLENHLQAESKQRLDLENRNTVIDNEMTKVWSQVRSLMEKNAELESTNRSQEQDLNMKRSTIRQVESSLTQKEATYEASTKALVAKAEAAEKKTAHLATEAEKAKDLQRELEDVTQKMLNVERQLAQVDTGKIQLEDTKDRLVTIRNQLEGEKLQRTLLDQTVAELKHQVALLKQRESKVSTENKGLQHTILDLEARLNKLQDSQTSGYDSAIYQHQQMSDVGKRSLMDQIARLQREVKELQYELYNVSERRDVDTKRYEERKLRTKAKLMKARDFYTTERSKYMDHMKHMDDDLRLTRAALTKEVEWREKMDGSYKQLLREKRDLISQLSEAEETLRDKTRSLSMAQVRVKYLEEETSRLQDRLQTLSQQKHTSDKLLKDYSRREKSRVASPVDQTGGTSGLGNSLDSGWDSNDLLQSWSTHIEPPANFRRTGVGVPGGGGVNDGSVDGGDRLVIMNNRNSGYRNETENSKSNYRSGPISGSILPKASGDYSLYTEIDVVKGKSDFYDDGDEFEA